MRASRPESPCTPGSGSTRICRRHGERTERPRRQRARRQFTADPIEARSDLQCGTERGGAGHGQASQGPERTIVPCRQIPLVRGQPGVLQLLEHAAQLARIDFWTLTQIDAHQLG
jgi:hypothetical protein